MGSLNFFQYITFYFFQHRIISLFSSLISGWLFGMCWSSRFTLCLLIGLPAFWLNYSRRISAFLYIWFYYLSANHEIIHGALRFFHHQHDIYFAVMLWLIHAFCLTLPWLFFYAKNWHPIQVYWRIFYVILVSILPPIGIIGWTHPLIAAGYLFPRLGFLGLFFTLLIMIFVATLRYKNRYHYFLILLLTVISLISHITYKAPQLASDWIAINTHQEPSPKILLDGYIRHERLINIAHAKILQGYKLIVFPENSGGVWWQATANQWQPVIQLAKQYRATIILGAKKIFSHTCYEQGVIIIDQDGWNFISARQSLPFAIWNPLSLNSPSNHWRASGIYSIAQRRILLSICYEDTVIWTNLLPEFISKPPQMIISLANLWWNTASGREKQQYSIESWSRLFNLPLLRAVND